MQIFHLSHFSCHLQPSFSISAFVCRFTSTFFSWIVVRMAAAQHKNHTAIVDILSVIDKGEKLQVVAAVDKILALLEDSKLAYRQSIQPHLVGCHMVNRNGYGLSPIEVHSVGAEIVKLGWSWSACAHAVCVEETVDGDIGRFSESLSAMSNMLAPSTAKDVAFGSLSCSHTNAFLAAVNAGCPTNEAGLAIDGRLSAAAIGGKDALFNEALANGLRWTVVRREVPLLYPTLCELIQHAKNATSTVARKESEVQLLLRIQEMMEAEMGPGVDKRPVDWETLYSKVMHRVISSDVGDVKALVNFVKRWGGGSGGKFISDLRLFHQVHISADRIIPSTTFDALYRLKTTVAESVPFFVMATVKAQGTCPPTKVVNRVCRYINKGDIDKVCSDEKKPLMLQANALLARVHALAGSTGVAKSTR